MVTFRLRSHALTQDCAPDDTRDAGRSRFAGDEAQFNLIAATLTCVGFAVVAFIAMFDAELFTRLARKDGDDGGGLFEHMTVAVMAVGVGTGVFALVKHRRRLPNPLLRLWLLGWTVACFYFMGEEASWGQWYFGWETPDKWQNLNKQDETNLHNISRLLGYYPQLLVQFFIILGGCFVPAAYLFMRKDPPRVESSRWILATWACWPASLAFAISWLFSKFEGDGILRVGTSEFRELLIAWFLTIYILSFLVRLRVAPDGADLGSREATVPHEPSGGA